MNEIVIWDLSMRIKLIPLGAIQIICDTLGGRGGVSKNVTRQFLLGISLAKVDKICHMGGGGSKKCGKSVTYYLNGPLAKLSHNS